MIIKNQFNLQFKEGGPETQKIHCPKCHNDRNNKTDKSLSVNITKRVFNCHHCGWQGRIDGWKGNDNYKKPDRSGWTSFSEAVQLFFAGRGISSETLRANKIIQKKFGDKVFIGFPYLNMQGDPVNVKWRSVEGKEFRQEAGAERLLFNLPMWATKKELIIVEGEIDVLTWNQCGMWNVTTLSDGAINEHDKSVDGKLQSVHACFEFIENKEKVYLCLDNDPPGRRLKEELIRLIGAEKCYDIAIPKEYKDSNEFYKHSGEVGIKHLLVTARPVPVSGIFYLADRLEIMVDNFHSGVRMGEKTYFGDVDRYFRWKPGQVNLFTGYMNFGKTTFVLQLMLTKSIMDGWKWCLFSPENYPAEDFYDDLIEMYVGKNVSDVWHNKMTAEQYLRAAEFINEHFVFVYPEDNHTVEALHEKFKHIIGRHGIQGVLIDPYNQVYKQFTGRSDEEISEFMTKVKRFTLKYNLCYNLIVHPRNPDKEDRNPDGSWKPVEFDRIMGGSMWGNKADNILCYHRPYWKSNDKDPTVQIIVQKVKRKRTGGERGTAEIFWDYKSSRFYDKHATSIRYFCDPQRGK